MKGAIDVYNAESIMVCVTQQKTCERLIQRGADLKNKLEGDLFVIHVAKEGVNFLGNKKEADALEYLFEISKGVGADLTVLRSANVTDTIIEFAQNKKIEHIILGEPPVESKDEGIINKLQERLPQCNFYIIPANELS